MYVAQEYDRGQELLGFEVTRTFSASFVEEPVHLSFTTSLFFSHCEKDDLKRKIRWKKYVLQPVFVNTHGKIPSMELYFVYFYAYK